MFCLLELIPLEKWKTTPVRNAQALPQLITVQMFRVHHQSRLATQVLLAFSEDRIQSRTLIVKNKVGRSNLPGSCLRHVQRSSQFVLQELARPSVGKVSRGGVVVLALMAGGKMKLPRIAVHPRIWLL